MPTTNYTDTQLLRMFPVLLPEDVKWEECESCLSEIETGEIDEESACNPFRWRDLVNREVKPTEYLDLCRRIEEKLDYNQKESFAYNLYKQNDSFFSVVDCDDCNDWSEVFKYTHASWQQRIIALCKVLEKEIPKL